MLTTKWLVKKTASGEGDIIQEKAEKEVKKAVETAKKTTEKEVKKVEKKAKKKATKEVKKQSKSLKKKLGF